MDEPRRVDIIVGSETEKFSRLHRCKLEWDDLAEAVPVGQGFLTFEDYAREYYGVKLGLDSYVGGIHIDYTVVDEKKHTVFLLKFGK